MKHRYALTLCSLLLACSTMTYADVIKEVRGDLDGDGQAEWVVVSDTGKSSVNDMGTMRTLEIFKLHNGKRHLWQKSSQVILPSSAGGMMGDPFADISIKNGSLFVNHEGGSSWKWSFRDQYRYQNGRFELIGYQNTSGKMCEEWTTIDANLQTGKIIFKQENESQNTDCPADMGGRVANINETFVNKNVKLHFGNRHAQEVYVIAPKSKQKIYFSSGI